MYDAGKDLQKQLLNEKSEMRIDELTKAHAA
jgi:hypothetical protein